MMPMPRLAWTEASASGDGLLLVVDLRLVGGVAVAVVIACAPAIVLPLGRLGSPFALLVALPPLALALEAFGWRDRMAARLVRIQPVLVRLLATYAAWLATSAALTLDVAAVAAASVGIAVAGPNEEERRWQLGGAILGANVGSLFFPFSNLTNLVLVTGSGIGLAGYVGLAIWPQLAAALAVGCLFAIRARRALSRSLDNLEVDARPAVLPIGQPDRLGGAAGGVALAGAATALIFGFTGMDMALPFAMVAALLAGFAVASGRLDIRKLARAVPLSGLAVIGLAAIAYGPMNMAAGILPHPDPTLVGLVLALGIGALLAMAINNLPAAAFGAVWLAGAHPATIVAFLIGTNVAALATPHGSVATLLARAVGVRNGITTPVGTYLRSAWRYAAIGTAAGLLALIIAAR
jgi:arsenical pump membrane protein